MQRNGGAAPPRGIPMRTLAVLALAVVAACFGLFIDTKPLDLDVYMTAGRAVWHGLDLYSPDVHVRQYGFTYPPFAAVLFALPAKLPFSAALVLMTSASLLSLAIVIKLSAPGLVAALYRPQVGAAVLAVAAMIVCEPVRATLWDGQINLILAALIMWDLLATGPARQRSWRGALIGVAAGIKLTPAIFVLYLLVRRRFRESAAAVAGFMATIAIGWLLLPDDSGRFWFHKLYDSSGIGDESRASNILGALLRTMDRPPAVAIWVVLSIPTLIVGLVAARHVSETGREAYAVGIVGVTGCLISPVTWTHHWVWCIPWLAGVGATALRDGRFARIGFGVLVFTYLALNLVPPSVTSRWSVSHFLSANALLFTAVGVAAGFALAWRVRKPEPVPSAV
jgi:alpha-1,2-mannosyltransferase